MFLVVREVREVRETLEVDIDRSLNTENSAMKARLSMLDFFRFKYGTDRM